MVVSLQVLFILLWLHYESHQLWELNQKIKSYLSNCFQEKEAKIKISMASWVCCVTVLSSLHKFSFNQQNEVEIISIQQDLRKPRLKQVSYNNLPGLEFKCSSIWFKSVLLATTLHYLIYIYIYIYIFF